MILRTELNFDSITAGRTGNNYSMTEIAATADLPKKMEWNRCK